MQKTMEGREIQRIVVATDGSECSERAVSYAAWLARRLSAKVHVLFVSETNFAGPWYYYVLDDEVSAKIMRKGKAIADKAVRSLRDGGVADVESHVEEGHPGDIIPEMAKRLDADLIVMGTHGRRGLERALMGSVAREVANTTSVPLLLVK
ncbi:universal stress protein [Candidatus Bipolaricaulota bacterium]|nr:universal stress protein [Candidatus Bipolaricaulota bacterium]